MNGALYGANALQTGAGFMISGLLGIMFGFYLEQAGFGSSRKLTGIFYFKDMAVLKVMFTAVIVAMLGYHYLVALGWLAPDSVYMLETYWLAQILGGLIFGAGFVIGGWCPGTAIVGAASAKLDALVFLAGVMLGSIFFNEIFVLIRPVYEGMYGGTIFLYDFLDLSPQWLVLVFCLIAVGAFAGSTWLESRTGKWPGLSSRRLRRQGMAAAAVVLCAGALFVIPARRPGLPNGGFQSGFLAEIARAEDHMEPMDLADAVMRGEADFILVDLRSAEEYSLFHLRGAVNIPLENLGANAEARLPRDRQIVLYSNGTTHAAQAWLELRHRGWRSVKVLTDGVLGFWRECLTPPSLSSPVHEQTAKVRFAAFAARRAYFMDRLEE
jgi:thiosulfate/3-mercaptopyruvate sulfurtransferase